MQKPTGIYEMPIQEKYMLYPNPDVHIKEVFYQIGVAEKDDIAVFEVIDKMAAECKEIDADVSPYKIDKILWLICSGKFYKDGITIGQHKDELIQYINEKIVGNQTNVLL